jgi:hypothetical protein
MGGWVGSRIVLDVVIKRKIPSLLSLGIEPFKSLGKEILSVTLKSSVLEPYYFSNFSEEFKFQVVLTSHLDP